MARLLYAGSDDGRLTVTRDGGEKWSDLNERIQGLPPHTYVSSVLPSRHLAGRVYATFDGHYDDDYRRLRLRERPTTVRRGDQLRPACPPRRCTSSASIRETRACCSSGTNAASTSPSTAARAGRR